MNAFTDPIFLFGMSHTMNTTEFSDYDAFVAETAIFAADRGIQYCIIKLCGEVGEFADKLASAPSIYSGVTDHFFLEDLDDATRDGLILELGDIMWYVTALSQQLGYNLTLLQAIRPKVTGTLPDGFRVLTLTLRMTASAGFIAERSGKVIRDHNGDGTNVSYNNRPDFNKATMMDLSNLHNRLKLLSRLLGSSLESVVAKNIKKLKSRRERGVLNGSGDNR